MVMEEAVLILVFLFVTLCTIFCNPVGGCSAGPGTLL
jgi:hypothetical protein